jgi:serine/threonine-protein kinase
LLATAPFQVRLAGKSGGGARRGFVREARWTRKPSPEHIQASKHADHRADLWSVSVIAFRSLTGQLPVTGQILDIVDGILKGTAPAPSTLAPDLSPAVDAFFARALARDINHRFQSARRWTGLDKGVARGAR